MASAPAPTLGVEVELAIFAPKSSAADDPNKPLRVFEKLAAERPSVRAARDHGRFFPQGLVYVELGRLLEAASWPASTLPDVLRQEDAVLALVRHGVRKAWPEARNVRAACYPDDVRGPPLPLCPDGLPAPPGFSMSMGTHINLRIAGHDARVRQAFILLAVLLPELVGPGGFVREPATGRLVFWRDPRSAHVAEIAGQNAHHAKRPVLKLTNDPRRIQVVSLGWTASAVDRAIKYGLFMLLNSAVLSGRRLPELEIGDLRVVLHAPPGCRIPYVRQGEVRQGTRLDLLEALLDDVLEPESATSAGRALRCERAVRLARHGIHALREREPADVALTFPASWALKHHVFESRYRGGRMVFPCQGRGALPGDDPLAEALAPLGILESDVVRDDVRRALFDATKPAGWTFDELYGPDPLALESLATDTLPAGAAGAAPEIFKHLSPPSPPMPPPAPPPASPPSPPPPRAPAPSVPDAASAESAPPPVYCDWEGKAHSLPPFLRRPSTRAAAIEEILRQAGLSSP